MQKMNFIDQWQCFANINKIKNVLLKYMIALFLYNNVFSKKHNFPKVSPPQLAAFIRKKVKLNKSSEIF